MRSIFLWPGLLEFRERFAWKHSSPLFPSFGGPIFKVSRTWKSSLFKDSRVLQGFPIYIYILYSLLLSELKKWMHRIDRIWKHRFLTVKSLYTIIDLQNAYLLSVLGFPWYTFMMGWCLFGFHLGSRAFDLGRFRRMILAILLIMARGGVWVLEQPVSSLDFRHPRFQLLLKYCTVSWWWQSIPKKNKNAAQFHFFI